MGLEMTTIADGVHFAYTPLVSWVVLAEGNSVALIDAGYPGQLDEVEESVRRVGHHPEQIETVLVTHAHVDHIGTVPELVSRYGTRVLTSELEARHVRGEVHESATPLDVLRRSYNPRIAKWGLQVAAAGGTKHPQVDTVQAIPLGTPLDLPRSPVAVSLAGHTSGHRAYIVPEAGAIALGDALATAHPTTGTVGPQLLMSFFHQDEAQLRTTLADLRRVEAEHLMPGHGPTQQRRLAEAIDEALARG